MRSITHKKIMLWRAVNTKIFVGSLKHNSVRNLLVPVVKDKGVEARQNLGGDVTRNTFLLVGIAVSMKHDLCGILVLYGNTRRAHAKVSCLI